MTDETPGTGSLLEGEQLPDGREETHKRVELLGTPGGRRPIDAGWSRKKRTVVTASLSGIALVALVGGAIWMIGRRPPSLPTSADEAVAVINSERFDRLDEQRRRQYLSEAARQLGVLDQDALRAMFADEANRDAMREIMRNRMDEVARQIARQIARGEDPDFGAMRGMRGPRPGGQGGPPGGPGGAHDPGQTSAEMRKRMRDRMNQHITEAITSGNAQSMGLRMEMMRRFRGGGGRRGP